MSNCFKRPESLLIALKIAAVHQYKNGKKLIKSEASTNIFLSLSDMHLILKPKHQSICMRFSYLAKNLQILHWVVLRLRESPFSKEDFCNMYKIFKKFY